MAGLELHIPATSPVAHLADALTLAADALAEHGDVLPPAFQQALFSAICATLSHLVLLDAISRGRVADALDDASEH